MNNIVFTKHVFVLSRVVEGVEIVSTTLYTRGLELSQLDGTRDSAQTYVVGCTQLRALAMASNGALVGIGRPKYQ